MPVPEYDLRSYTDRPPVVEQVSRLNDLCFAEYPGVVEGGEPFMRWYMARPGLDAALSRAAWSGDDPVAGLFVTVLNLYLGGLPRAVGVIDTVMTHPDHRRRGLARSLLTAVIEDAHERDLAALQLYTVPGSPGHRLYNSLGFRDRAILRYWMVETGSSSPSGGWRPSSPAEHAGVRAAIEASHARYDGVPRLDSGYWAWRRTERPPEFPAETWTRRHDDGAPETVALLPVSMTTLGRQTVLGDVVVHRPDGLESLGAHLPAGRSLVVLADEADSPLTAALRQAGFRSGASEAVMLLPLQPDVPTQAAGRPWFPLTESVIGV